MLKKSDKVAGRGHTRRDDTQRWAVTAGSSILHELRPTRCKVVPYLIELAARERRVVEARRFANARIDAHDLGIIASWARENALSVADGL